MRWRCCVCRSCRNIPEKAKTLIAIAGLPHSNNKDIKIFSSRTLFAPTRNFYSNYFVRQHKRISTILQVLPLFDKNCWCCQQRWQLLCLASPNPPSQCRFDLKSPIDCLKQLRRFSGIAGCFRGEKTTVLLDVDAAVGGLGRQKVSNLT